MGGFGAPGGKSARKGKKGGKSGNPMKREAEEKALRERLSGKGRSGGNGGSAFQKQPQNPALPAGLQMGENGMPELPPNLGGGLGGLFGR